MRARCDEVTGRSPGDDATALENDEPVDRPLRLAHVVGDQEDGGAVVGECADLVPQQTAAHGIDVIGRLVEDDEPPRDDGAHGEGGQPRYSAGDLLGRSAGPLADVEGVDELLRPPAHTTPVGPADASDEFDGALRRQPGDRDVGLGLDARGAPGRGGPGDRIEAVESDGPGCGAQQAHHLVDQRALARPVVSEQSDDLAGGHVHRDGVVGAHGARTGAEVLVEVGDGEQILVHPLVRPLVGVLADGGHARCSLTDWYWLDVRIVAVSHNRYTDRYELGGM